MVSKGSEKDTSYRAIKRGTTRSCLKCRTNNDNLPRRPRSLEKGGGEDRAGKKETKSSPKKGGPDTMPNGNSTDYIHTKMKNFKTKHGLEKVSQYPHPSNTY